MKLRLWYLHGACALVLISGNKVIAYEPSYGPYNEISTSFNLDEATSFIETTGAEFHVEPPTPVQAKLRSVGLALGKPFIPLASRMMVFKDQMVSYVSRFLGFVVSRLAFGATTPVIVEEVTQEPTVDQDVANCA